MANLSRHHVGRKLASFETAGWIELRLQCELARLRDPSEAS